MKDFIICLIESIALSYKQFTDVGKKKTVLYGRIDITYRPIDIGGTHKSLTVVYGKTT